MELNDEPTIKRLNVNDLNPNEELLNYKIILVGDSGVGKTCILMRAVNNRYTDAYQATIGFEFLLLYFQVNDVKIKLQIWDTCGQEIYRSLIQGFFRNTTATVLVYSKTNRSSFDNLGMWIKDIKNNTEQDMPIFLVGNKCDEVNRNIVVTKEEGEEYSKQYNLKYFNETSAKSGININEVFEEVAKVVYKDHYLKRKPRKQMDKMTLEKKEDKDNKDFKKPKKKCC